MFASEQSTPPLALGPQIYQIHPLNAAFYGQQTFLASLLGCESKSKHLNRNFSVCVLLHYLKVALMPFYVSARQRKWSKPSGSHYGGGESFLAYANETQFRKECCQGAGSSSRSPPEEPYMPYVFRGRQKNV